MPFDDQSGFEELESSTDCLDEEEDDMQDDYFRIFPQQLDDYSISRLSLDATGAFLVLLNWMWKGPLRYKLVFDEDYIMHKLSIRPSQWKRIRRELLEDDNPVFREEDGYLVSDMLKPEAERRQRLSEQAARAGAASGQARQQNASKTKPKPAPATTKQRFDRALESAANPSPGRKSTGQTRSATGTQARQARMQRVMSDILLYDMLSDSELSEAYQGYIPTLRFEDNGEVYIVSDDYIERLKRAYPDVDILEQLEQLYHWNCVNLDKRKKLNYMENHINNWMENAQNRQGLQPRRRQERQTTGEQDGTQEKTEFEPAFKRKSGRDESGGGQKNRGAKSTHREQMRNASTAFLNTLRGDEPDGERAAIIEGECERTRH